jgi:uncharacterized protein YerC
MSHPLPNPYPFPLGITAKKALICSSHFTNFDYRQTLRGRVLNETATPTLNLPESYTAAEPMDIGEDAVHYPRMPIDIADEVEVTSNYEIGTQVEILSVSGELQLKNQIKALKHTIGYLNTTIGNFEKEVLQYKKKLEEQGADTAQIARLKESASEGSQMANFILDQMHNFERKPHAHRWSESTIRHAIVWRIASPKGYVPT